MSCENGNEYHDGTGSDFGCKLRSVSFGNAGKPGLNKTLTGVPKQPNNSWERGIVRDSRNMPMLTNDKGVVREIGVKEYANNRSKFEEARRKLHNS